jgi:uncharacterized membrane protein
MMVVLLPLHILAALIWVGGMFFAHFMLRPSVGPLDPAIRLGLWRRVFARFFPWVWAAIAVLLVSGFTMRDLGLGGRYVDLMMGIAIIMMLAFAHLYFAPWKRFRRAVDGGNFAEAGKQITQIRYIVTFNLALGLIVAVIGAGGRFWG